MKLLEQLNKIEANKRDYNRKAMPEVLKYNKQWRKENPDKFLYNSVLENYIKEKENLPDDHDLIDKLSMEVYLSQRDYSKELEDIQDREMLEKGYKKIEWDMTYRGAVEIIAKKENDWHVTSVKTIGKIVNYGLPMKGETQDGFFIPKGRRTRGYRLMSLKGYYKAI